MERTEPRHRSPFMVVVLAVSFLPSCGGSGSGAGAARARVVELDGSVLHNGQPAKANVPLEPGDKLHAPKGAFVRIQMADGSRFLLVGRGDEGAEFEMADASEKNGLWVMLVKLGKGTVSFVVPAQAKGKSRYEIEAVTSLTVVRGTEGKVQVDASGDTVALKSGEVEVVNRATGESRTLGKFQQITVSSSGEFSEASAYDFSDAAEQSIYNVGPINYKVFEK